MKLFTLIMILIIANSIYKTKSQNPSNITIIVSNITQISVNITVNTSLLLVSPDPNGCLYFLKFTGQSNSSYYKPNCLDPVCSSCSNVVLNQLFPLTNYTGLLYIPEQPTLNTTYEFQTIGYEYSMNIISQMCLIVHVDVTATPPVPVSLSTKQCSYQIKRISIESNVFTPANCLNNECNSCQTIYLMLDDLNSDYQLKLNSPFSDKDSLLSINSANSIFPFTIDITPNMTTIDVILYWIAPLSRNSLCEFSIKEAAKSLFKKVDCFKRPCDECKNNTLVNLIPNNKYILRLTVDGTHGCASDLPFKTQPLEYVVSFTVTHSSVQVHFNSAYWVDNNCSGNVYAVNNDIVVFNCSSSPACRHCQDFNVSHLSPNTDYSLQLTSPLSKPINESFSTYSIFANLSADIFTTSANITVNQHVPDHNTCQYQLTQNSTIILQCTKYSCPDCKHINLNNLMPKSSYVFSYKSDYLFEKSVYNFTTKDLKIKIGIEQNDLYTVDVLVNLTYQTFEEFMCEITLTSLEITCKNGKCPTDCKNFVLLVIPNKKFTLHITSQSASTPASINYKTTAIVMVQIKPKSLYHPVVIYANFTTNYINPSNCSLELRESITLIPINCLNGSCPTDCNSLNLVIIDLIPSTNYKLTIKSPYLDSDYEYDSYTTSANYMLDIILASDSTLRVSANSNFTQKIVEENCVWKIRTRNNQNNIIYGDNLTCSSNQFQNLEAAVQYVVLFESSFSNLEFGRAAFTTLQKTVVTEITQVAANAVKLSWLPQEAELRFIYRINITERIEHTTRMKLQQLIWNNGKKSKLDTPYINQLNLSSTASSTVFTDLMLNVSYQVHLCTQILMHYCLYRIDICQNCLVLNFNLKYFLPVEPEILNILVETKYSLIHMKYNINVPNQGQINYCFFAISKAILNNMKKIDQSFKSLRVSSVSSSELIFGQLNYTIVGHYNRSYCNNTNIFTFGDGKIYSEIKNLSLNTNINSFNLNQSFLSIGPFSNSHLYEDTYYSVIFIVCRVVDDCSSSYPTDFIYTNVLIQKYIIIISLMLGISLILFFSSVTYKILNLNLLKTKSVDTNFHGKIKALILNQYSKRLKSITSYQNGKFSQLRFRQIISTKDIHRNTGTFNSLTNRDLFESSTAIDDRIVTDKSTDTIFKDSASQQVQDQLPLVFGASSRAKVDKSSVFSMDRKVESVKEKKSQHESVKEITGQYESVIRASEIGAFVEKCSHSSNYIFLKIWESIDSISPQIINVALKEHNKIKNRYHDILTHDYYRVVLSKINNNSNSDYINATYISGFFDDEEYIATQGPTNDTVIDFWRMVAEKNVHSIVMLTNFVELGKIKCEKYLPELGKEFNFKRVGLIVETIKSQDHSDIVITTLNLIYDEKSRLVEHFHYKAWPDHGVPSDIKPLTTLRNMLRKYQPNPQTINCRKLSSLSSDGENVDLNSKISKLISPIVVHCSAGVGRTGTFITIDYNLNRLAKNEKSYDVVKFIKNMRLRRSKMVQTDEQLMFIFYLLYSLQSRNNEFFTLDELEYELNMALKNNPNKIAQLFSDYVIRDSKILDMISYRLPIVPNISKIASNRYSVLEKSRNDLCSTYVSSLLTANIFISTLNPTVATTYKFLDLVVNHKLKLIVHIDDSVISHNSYFFSGKTIRYDDYEVTVMKEESRGNVLTRMLVIQKKSFRTVVKHMEYLSLDKEAANNCSPDFISFLVSIIDMIKVMSNNTAPYCLVHSSSPQKYSSLIFAILSIVEITQHGMNKVNLKQVIKVLREGQEYGLPEFEEFLLVIKASFEAIKLRINK